MLWSAYFALRGCMGLTPAARGSQEARFAQPLKDNFHGEFVYHCQVFRCWTPSYTRFLRVGFLSFPLLSSFPQESNEDTAAAFDRIDGCAPNILFPKHDSRILRLSSHPVCGFSMMERVRLCAVWPTENWLGSSLNHLQGWIIIWECCRQALGKRWLMCAAAADGKNALKVAAFHCRFREKRRWTNVAEKERLSLSLDTWRSQDLNDNASSNPLKNKFP